MGGERPLGGPRLPRLALPPAETEWQLRGTPLALMSPTELEGCLEHIEQHDHYEMLWDQLRMLDAAGFSGVDCAWRYLNYGVFTAQA